MSISDVLSRIGQLQQLIAPGSSTSGAGVSDDGQDFQTMFASVTGGTGTDPSAGTPTAAAPASTASTVTSQVAAAAGMPAFGTTATATTATGNDVVADAIQYLGVPYKWGGTDPASGLDCSGLVQKVFADKGVTLPRTSAEQATTGTEVAGGLANAQPGDLVFFGSPVHHVGIYAGNGMMVEAPHTGTNVQVHTIDVTPSHVRRISLPVTAPVATTPAVTATTPALLGSQMVASTSAASAAAATAGTNPVLPVGTTAAATLASLSAVDPATALDALGVPASLRPALTAAAASQNLPVSLLAAVAKVESGFNLSETSTAGAQGLMQLMPDTAAGIGANPWDPTSAANGAAKLLRGYIDQYGSVPLALAAYNAGPGAVAKYGGIPPYAETQAYVQRVGALAAAA